MNIAQQTINDEVNLAAMQNLLQQQKTSFEKEGVASAETRIARIDTVIEILINNQDALADALYQDFGCRSKHQSLMSDIAATLLSLKHNKKHLSKWMKAEKRPVEKPLAIIGAKARIEYQAKGVIGVLGTWNFPINTVLSPLAGILAAGNRAILKFSEMTPATSSLMESLIAKHFDPEVVCCISGGPEVGAAFSGLPFDHLIFTGSGGIGKHVMRAAAENLTPVTLELGGKSPVIIAEDANIKDAAIRICSGKILNAGQVCLSPDYIFVPEHKRDELLAEIQKWVSKMYPTMLNNDDYNSIINKRHYDRIQSYIADAKNKALEVIEINPANEDFSQQQNTHKIPFTLILNPSDDAEIMQHEIFGSVLAIKTYTGIQECIDYINAHPRPLGLYIFSQDKTVQDDIIKYTRSGGVCINDVLMHVSAEDLPFGGIGGSGMGNYHGKEGFITFSHARSVFSQSKINLQRISGMLPPYTAKTNKMLKLLIKQ